MSGGVLVGSDGGRPVYWDSPQATPDGVIVGQIIVLYNGQRCSPDAAQHMPTQWHFCLSVNIVHCSGLVLGEDAEHIVHSISVRSMFPCHIMLSISPNGLVLQVKMEMPVAPGMVAPLDGTPDEQGVNGTPEGGKKNKSGGPRRKVGRWSEEETNTLIMLTNQVSRLDESDVHGGLEHCSHSHMHVERVHRAA